MIDFVKQGLDRIAENLTNLEINTIIDDRANIIGTKLPPPRLALIEIAKEYQDKLEWLGADVEDSRSADPGSYEVFLKLRDIAKWTFAQAERPRWTGERTVAIDPAASDWFMFKRIEDMSNQIILIFEDLRSRNQSGWENHVTLSDIATAPPLELGPDQVAVIRKAWEIGVQEIAVQTVVQIDGDVITRIQSRHATGGSEALLGIHNGGVQLSVGYWRDLVQIAADLLRTLFARVSRSS